MVHNIFEYLTYFWSLNNSDSNNTSNVYNKPIIAIGNVIKKCDELNIGYVIKRSVIKNIKIIFKLVKNEFSIEEKYFFFVAFINNANSIKHSGTMNVNGSAEKIMFLLLNSEIPLKQ